MSYRPQRDPFDDGMQSLVSAMNVSHRVPGAKEPDMQSLGKKIINNARTRPEFARKVAELYTNEDSWLSNFLRKEIQAAKPAIKPEYFGGSPDEKTVAVGDSINATTEQDEDSGSESGGESASDVEDDGLEVLTVEGEMSKDKLESMPTLTRVEQVQLLRMILPDTALNVEAVKSGKTLAVRVFVQDEAAAVATKKDFKEQQKELKNNPDFKTKSGDHLRKVLKFVLKKKNNVIQVVPARFKYLSPSPKKASKKSETMGTPASTAIAASLSNSGGAESAV
jgi:hypothetical protein